MKTKTILACCLLFGFGGAHHVYGQTKKATDDLQQLRAAVAKTPDSLNVHHQFIAAFKKSIPNASFRNTDSVVSLLQGQYATWMKQFPRSATVPYAIGEAFADGESPKARTYLLKAVKLDPKLAAAWLDLAFDAERWGDQTNGIEYMRKAAEADPDNPSYAFYHAMNFEETDPAKWRSSLYDLAKRFPQSERGAQGLYWLATRSNDTIEKIKVYEQLRTLYPPEKFSWSSGGMQGLFSVYINTDPAKAVQLAENLANLEGWKSQDTLARKFLSIRQALGAKQYQQAATLLENVRLPRYSSLTNTLALLKAQAAHGLGKTDDAYKGLVAVFAKDPTDNIRSAIDQYAAVLGKNGQQVMTDVWEIRSKTMKPAPAFDLPQYLKAGNLSLKDLSGKVVLLTFWFPGCGPCRGEFPHFQEVINKFSKEKVAYVGINVATDQDPYVKPFMSGTGYSFIPLRDGEGTAQKDYKVRGEPTNFLIDQNGQMVFTDFRTDGSNGRTLELMISSLLEK
ncbi:redoxin domain-containing protein [Chitinophaga qingshengii]|uniref:Redoxin domain-containing protein n=1 Tax=Chitinophaga qingshengii TaxID=1569794 RepID=A0ABR7TUA6_9BACT|nr:redoxin domain-containing protein [Chitinophaga qingshengii]MBC9933026.1 redoxin domain-containing protein [Chitinophaga qingshengii]